MCYYNIHKVLTGFEETPETVKMPSLKVNKKIHEAATNNLMEKTQRGETLFMTLYLYPIIKTQPHEDAFSLFRREEKNGNSYNLRLL